MRRTVSQKIDAAGGTTAVARQLGVPVTTVHAWSKKDKVPHWREAAFEAAVAVPEAEQVAA